MAKAVSPAVGFNDNVRRRNRNFHVQTEDSGVAHPHIITHLFTDGGRIVKSQRQSYVDIVDDEQLSKKVRERMKAQHVGMLESLKSGEFDALVWGSRAPGAKPKPVPVEAPPSAGGEPVPSGVVSSTPTFPSQPLPNLPSSQPVPSQPVSQPLSSQMLPSRPEPVVEPAPESTPTAESVHSAGNASAPGALPVPPRRSTPPLARKPQPPARKTMPRIDTTSMPVLPAPSRPRKSVPPKVRRSSRPPPPRSASRPALANPRDGLLAQTLDEVILRMLSEEPDSKSGS